MIELGWWIIKICLIKIPLRISQLEFISEGNIWCINHAGEYPYSQLEFISEGNIWCINYAGEYPYRKMTQGKIDILW